MTNTKWGPRASTIAKYEQAMKRANILIGNTGKCDWIALTASYQINNTLSSLLQELKIVECHGSKGNHTYKWIGGEPDKAMAKKVLQLANKKKKIHRTKSKNKKELIKDIQEAPMQPIPTTQRKEINILWGLVKISFSNIR